MNRLPFAAIVVFGAPACTLLVSTSDLSSGGPAGPDSGNTVVTEGGAVGDGRIESVDAGFSCAAVTPAPAFCTTFDGAKFDPSSWDDTTTLTGSLAIQNGVLIAMSGATGEAFRPAFVQKNFTKLASLHIESDVRVDAMDMTSNGLGGRFLGIKGDGWNAMLGLGSDGAIRVTENWGANGGTNAFHGSGAFIIGTGFRVVFDVDFKAKRYTVVVDGKPISDATPIKGPIDAATPAAMIGVYYAPVTNGLWKIAYDNVVIDAN